MTLSARRPGSKFGRSLVPRLPKLLASSEHVGLGPRLWFGGRGAIVRSRAGMILGTAAYMSKRQVNPWISGQTSTGAAFSFGSILNCGTIFATLFHLLS